MSITPPNLIGDQKLENVKIHDVDGDFKLNFSNKTVNIYITNFPIASKCKSDCKAKKSK